MAAAHPLSRYTPATSVRQDPLRITAASDCRTLRRVWDIGRDVVDAELRALAQRWASDRRQRQSRRHLDRVDFDDLAACGFLQAIVPVEHGGMWHDVPRSVRALAETLRVLSQGDPAVALVSAMHPAVIAFWLLNPEPADPAWQEQRSAVFASAMAGERWGTITSEPGSGGDILRSKAVAEPSDEPPFIPGASYRITGDKHFGSGSGIVDRMMTTALPTGDDLPTVFAMDVRGRAWDGGDGLRLVAEWDGVGMSATQSHAMRLESMPAVRLARPGPITEVTAGAGAVIATLFTAVVVGVVDAAIEHARSQLQPRAAQLRPYEQVEWSAAVTDYWLLRNSYEGALRALELGEQRTALAALCAKESVAELSERTVGRLARVIGGGSYSQRNPLAHWFEDVRALGFLRPPWGLAFDTLFALSLD
jgi:alkylation response protein AidB-like acyl-CoA dehydrogenase